MRALQANGMTGSEVKLDGEEYLILREEDILGILD